jgi:hypothetical protein
MRFPELAEIVSDELGTGKVRSIHVPPFLCGSLAAANAMAAKTLGLRPLLNMDKLPEGLSGGWVWDARRLTGQLGFQFPVSLQRRLRQAAKSYQEKGWL